MPPIYFRNELKMFFWSFFSPLCVKRIGNGERTVKHHQDRPSARTKNTLSVILILRYNINAKSVPNLEFSICPITRPMSNVIVEESGSDRRSHKTKPRSISIRKTLRVFIKLTKTAQSSSVRLDFDGVVCKTRNLERCCK